VYLPYHQKVLDPCSLPMIWRGFDSECRLREASLEWCVVVEVKRRRTTIN